MADNVIADAGSGGATFATDDIGGVHYPINKLTIGALDSQTLLSGGNGVTDAGTIRVTVSSDSTGVLSVDDNGGSLTVDNGGTFAVQVDGDALTALQLIDNIVQVEDAVHGDGDSGVMALAVRNDVLAALAGTDGDYAPLQVNATGALYVAIDGTVTVSATALDIRALTNADVVTAELSATDNAVLDQIEVNTSYGDNTGTGTEAGCLRVTIATDSTGVVSIDDNGGSITVDASALDIRALTNADVVTAELSAVDNAVLDQIEVNTSYGDNTGTGTEAGCLRVTIATDSTGVVSIDDNGGSLTVDATALDIRALTNADVVTAELSATDNAVLDDIAARTSDPTVAIDDTTTHTPGTTKVVGIGAVAATLDSVESGDIGMLGMSLDRRLLVDADIVAHTGGPVSIDDNGGSLTVDASALDIRALTNADVVTAELSATDNAVLDQIEVNTSYGDNTGAGTEAGCLRVTIANDSTGVVSIDDNGGAITVDNGGTFVTQVDGDALTALQLIDDSIFADDAAFTLTTSKVTMVGAIRDDTLSTLAAVEGDAVPLRVSSTGALHVTGGGGGTEYTLGTDTYLEGTSIGSAMAVVRNDGGGSLVNTDNEFTALQVDSAGALRVTGGGGGTEYNEDVATPATIVGTATLMERDDALSTLTPIEGDWAAFRCNARGALWVELDLTNDVTIADGGNSITVDATALDIRALTNADVVTAELSAVDNAVLDQIEVNTSYGDNTGAGTEAGCLRVTIANDSTGTLTVDNAGTFATQIDGDALTALQKIDNIAHSGSDVALVEHVPISGQLDDTATTTVTENQIAPVRITSARALHVAQQGTVTVSATALDVRALTNADVVTAELSATDNAVLDQIEVNTSYGDNTGAGTEAGCLRVTIANDSTGVVSIDDNGASITVDGTFQYTQDDPAGVNPDGIMALMVRDDTLSPTLVTAENDAVAMRCNEAGALWVTIGDRATDDTTTHVSGTTKVLGIGAVATPTDASVDANDIGMPAMTTDRRLHTQATQSGTWNVTNISGTVSLPTGAATAANQATHTTALQLIDNMIVAHDAAITGATGLAAIGLNARSTSATAVQDGDAVRALATLLGKQVNYPYAIPANTWSYASPAAVTDTADDAAKAAAGAGIRNYITAVQVFNGHDTVGTEVVVKDGSTVLWRGWAEQTGGGCSAKFDPPLRGTANTAVNVANITTGSSTYFNLQGFVAAE